CTLEIRNPQLTITAHTGGWPTDTYNCFISNCFISNRFISNRFISNCFISNCFISNCFISNYFISNRFISNCFISNCFISNRFTYNCFISNRFISNCFISCYNSSSKNVSIYIPLLLLLLGLGGVGVLYWRCRGHRQGQAESQDQRRLKREQEVQMKSGPMFVIFSGSCTLENREPLLTITAHAGESVLLPCYCTDLQTKPEELRWTIDKKYTRTRVEISIESNQYRNRVQMFNDHSPGNLSLLISHLTEEDRGVYICAVKDSHINIRLILKVCTLKNRERLLTITARTGGSVLLPCSCPDLQIKPANFSWRKHIRNTQTWEEVSRESDQYRNRVQLVNDHSPGNLSLLISHLTEGDGGVYQCAVKDSHINIRLTIEEPPQSLPFVPFALVTVILLHIIVAVVYYTSRTKGCTLENSEQQLQHKRPLPIIAHTRGSVLLPCSCTDLQTKPEEFRWKRANGNTWVEMAINSGQYRNRVQLVNDHSPGNLSLLISHLTEEDGGVYQCAVKGSHISIRLTLEVCTLENRERLLTITAPTGGSVLLPCSCTDLQTKPANFTWTKYIRNTQSWEEISRESDQYRNRVQLVNDHSPGNLSLLISHLTEEDGGDYQCAVKDSETFIRLTIEGKTQFLLLLGPTYTFNCFISHCFISNCFISNYFISNCFISNCFISNCFISNYFISNCFIFNCFISHCFISNCFISNCFISNCYISNCYIFNCFISNYFISNCYISNYFISNCFIFNCFISNYFISNCFIFNCSIFNCFIFNCFISCWGSAKAAMSTAVVNGHTSPANALSDTSRTPVSDKSSSKTLFIYILLLLLGLGGVGVLYWRCRGRRQGQVESQDQRRMKREQEAQIPQDAGQCNGAGKRLLLVTLRWSVNVSPQSLPFVPFALVTVILLHVIVAVVYYTSRTKGTILPEFTTALLMEMECATLSISAEGPPTPSTSTPVRNSQTKPGSSPASSAEFPDEPPPSLPFVPFALVTVILLHIIVAVVYYTSRTKGPDRVHYHTGDGDGVVSLD
ncbi:hypothetical protein NFI96_027661, partial [Prochilodus magdalenae]